MNETCGEGMGEPRGELLFFDFVFEVRGQNSTRRFYTLTVGHFTITSPHPPVVSERGVVDGSLAGSHSVEASWFAARHKRRVLERATSVLVDDHVLAAPGARASERRAAAQLVPSEREAPVRLTEKVVRAPRWRFG